MRTAAASLVLTHPKIRRFGSISNFVIQCSFRQIAECFMVSFYCSQFADKDFSLYISSILILFSTSSTFLLCESKRQYIQIYADRHIFAYLPSSSKSLKFRCVGWLSFLSLFGICHKEDEECISIITCFVLKRYF